jgi:hypothetical protein
MRLASTPNIARDRALIRSSTLLGGAGNEDDADDDIGDCAPARARLMRTECTPAVFIARPDAALMWPQRWVRNGPESPSGTACVCRRRLIQLVLEMAPMPDNAAMAPKLDASTECMMHYHRGLLAERAARAFTRSTWAAVHAAARGAPQARARKWRNE